MTVTADNGILNIPFGKIENGALILRNGSTASFDISNGALFILERRSIMKQDRNRLMYFASFDGTAWEVLGRDNDDLSKELNPDTETSKNVLGEATFKHNGYEPEVSVDPYYADTESTLYEKLCTAAIQEKYGDEDIKGYFIEVIFDKVDTAAGTMSGTGYKRDAYIVPQSTGGDTSGLGIPFTVNPVGAMTAVNVVYTIATRDVKVTPAS
ncbi:MAG: hypothetical protein ACI4F7_10585 [Acutalibacteraceae bacterium]